MLFIHRMSDKGLGEMLFSQETETIGLITGDTRDVKRRRGRDRLVTPVLKVNGCA